MRRNHHSGPMRSEFTVNMKIGAADADRLWAVLQPRVSRRSRYERDVHFRSLVGMLEATLRNHQFSPSELREACILAATRYELRTNRAQLVLREDQVEAFLRRTELAEREVKDQERSADKAFAALLLDHPELIRLTEEQKR